MTRKESLSGIIAILVVLASVMFQTAQAKAPLTKGNKPQQVHKVATNDVYSAMDINNILNFYSNNGDGSFNIYTTSDEGFEFPIGSNDGTCIFEDGVVWTAYKGDSLLCGGSTYNHGLQAGRILQDGTATALPVADDPGKEEYRVYNVRPDIKPTSDAATIAAETATIENSEVSGPARLTRFFTTSASALFDQYTKDWMEWPAAQGAPWYVDSIGTLQYNDATNTFDPNNPHHIPGFPGADQTQWMVMNDVNTTLAQNLYSSDPIGVEVQRTIWSYKRPGALGNTIFLSYKIINRSGVRLDTMYVAQWADPDLGYAGDDAVGCDTTRSLGYVYNGESRDANFANLGLPPPAVGFDFFQGPKVLGAATDTAIFDMQKIPGSINLPMTAFAFFINGNDLYTDPNLRSNGPNGNKQWYNLMRGRVSTSGEPFQDPSGNVSMFVFPGDPVSNSGWTYLNDGSVSPADVRMGLCSGPFTMNPGDTQQVVVAAIAGLGGDYLSSITVLKSYDDIAQSAYNALFQLAVPPPQPVVHVAALNNEIVLSWGDPTASPNPSTKIESSSSRGYNFEGYNVYQFPRSNPSGGKLLATYDLVDGIKTVQDTAFDAALGTYVVTNTQFGTDNGIQHSITITQDAISAAPIVNNRDYYFAVTAYSFNPTAGLVPHALESSPIILGVRPEAPASGVRLGAASGDTVQVTHNGGSDGTVETFVNDPTVLTGNSYEISFAQDATSGDITWQLKDVSKNTIVTSGLAQTPAGGLYPPAIVINGVSIQVFGPPNGMKGYKATPSTARPWTGTGGNVFGLEGFGGAMGMAWNQWYTSSTIDPLHLHKVLLKFATADADGNIADLSDPNVSSGYRYLRASANPPALPEFAPFIVNVGPPSTYTYQDRRPMQFAAFDEDNNNQRLDVGFLENNSGVGRVDGRFNPPTYESGTPSSDPREWFFIFATPYSTTDNPVLKVDILNETTPMMWFGTPIIYPARSYTAGSDFEIIPNYPNGPTDTFTFSTVAPTKTAADQKADINQINVFPNPYFGFNRLESDKYTRWVRFTHLPEQATIRIFNLAGVLVRTLVKTDPASQFMDWNLLNEHQLPIAAGMYIAYVDCPGLGTKTLKLAVIPEQQFLDHY